MLELNTKHRRKKKPTDVLSFRLLEWSPPGKLTTPFFRGVPLLMGEVVLCPRYIQREHDLAARIPILLVHAALHLQGHDHETDEEYEVMQAAEDRVLASLS